MRPRRFLIVVVAALGLGASGAWAKEPPLVGLELRAGTGVAMGGGAGTSNFRLAPLVVKALADVAVVETPWVSLYGELFVEGRGRAAVGVSGGARVRVAGSPLRASAGVTGIFVPYTILGGTLGVGACFGGNVGFCVDLEGTAFVAGGDLPSQRVASQALVVVGVTIDAL